MKKIVYVVYGLDYVDYDSPITEIAHNSDILGVFEDYEKANDFFNKKVIEVFHVFLEDVFDGLEEANLFVNQEGTVDENAPLWIYYNEYKNGNKTWIVWENTDEIDPFTLIVYPKIFLERTELKG